MKLSEELLWRGLVKDKTFENLTWIDDPKTFYLGADCSSDSLTIGNLAVFLLARRLIEAGWKAVLLVGGATSLIGDPGGKEAERDLKTRAEIALNVDGIKAQVQKIFAEQEFELVDNYDWFKDVGYLEFLREVGKHYSMTELIQRDFIASRIGDNGGGISYAEFSYSLIQGYDYWHLFKTQDVVLQIGGSDQWGNMLSGVPLIRKKEAKEVHAMSMPLVINKATGKKFGKSEEGAVWLDSARTTPTQFYQFWINADDAGVEDYLKVYTFMQPDEITAIMAQHHENPSARIAQKTLAHEVTTMLHGLTETHIAETVTDVLTGATNIGSVNSSVIDSMKQEIASVAATENDSIVNTLVSSGLAESNTEARRLLAGNAIAINGKKVQRETFELGDFQNGHLLLRKGKKFKDSALITLERSVIAE